MSLFQVTQNDAPLPDIDLFSKTVNANVVSVCDLQNNVRYSLPSDVPSVDSLLRFSGGSVYFSPSSDFEQIDSGAFLPASPRNGQMFFYEPQFRPIWYALGLGGWVYSDGLPLVPSP